MTGIAAGLLLSASLDRLNEFGAHTRLVSDCDGALKEIDVHYVREFNDDSIETLADLLAALPRDVTVRVVVAQQADFEFLRCELTHRGVNQQRNMTPVVTGEPVTPWAKDRFGTLETRFGKPVLAVPPARSLAAGARAHDERVPDRLAHELPELACQPLPFFFEGGDLLSDRTNVYVASTLLARNSSLTQEGPDSFVETMGAVFGRRVVRLGRESDDVPDHHIGMYLTPLGDSAVAVGDPSLGHALCARLSDGGQSLDAATDEATDKPFHEVRKELERQGLRVVRVPLVPTHQPRVYVTYNNCILETRSGEKRIYMPVYGVPSLDEAARRTYEAEGWTVLTVRVGKLYRHTGSLRCLVGIIRRA